MRAALWESCSTEIQRPMLNWGSRWAATLTAGPVSSSLSPPHAHAPHRTTPHPRPPAPQLRQRRGLQPCGAGAAAVGHGGRAAAASRVPLLLLLLRPVQQGGPQQRQEGRAGGGFGGALRGMSPGRLMRLGGHSPGLGWVGTCAQQQHVWRYCQHTLLGFACSLRLRAHASVAPLEAPGAARLIGPPEGPAAPPAPLAGGGAWGRGLGPGHAAGAGAAPEQRQGEVGRSRVGRRRTARFVCALRLLPR